MYKYTYTYTYTYIYMLKDKTNVYRWIEYLLNYNNEKKKKEKWYIWFMF